MANSEDPDETLHSATSHLGLHCLLRPVCPNTYSKYGSQRNGQYLTLRLSARIILLPLSCNDYFFFNVLEKVVLSDCSLSVILLLLSDKVHN